MHIHTWMLWVLEVSLPDFLGHWFCYLVTMWSLSHRSAKDNYRMNTLFESFCKSIVTLCLGCSLFSLTLLSGNCTVILLENAKIHAPPNKNLYPCTSCCQKFELRRFTQHLLKSYFLCICSSFTMPEFSQAAYPQSCQNCKQRNKKVKPFF